MPPGTSHVWLGVFVSEGALDEYFREEDPTDLSRPLSRFAEDQGVQAYDHDWVERGFDGSGDLRTLMRGHACSDDTVGLLVARAAELGVSGANSVIMADRGEFPSPRSVERKTYRLWYLGAFPGGA